MKNKKARDMQGLFVAEGSRFALEAPGDLVEQVLMSRSYAAVHPEAEGCFRSGIPVEVLEDSRFASISDTKNPQGILAVVRKMEFDERAVLNGIAPFLLLLEDLQDPGNVGTILRTAEAAGVDGVFLTEGSVDLYSPKTTRATMGSIYRVPHFYVSDARGFLAGMKQMEITSYAAHLRGVSSYTDCSYKRGSVLVIGNEGRGITDETAEQCEKLIRIPMMGQVESLNAAMAAGILMYEVQRQRRILE